ncbi:MAG: hypothetical protein PHV06_05130 [bacterium]|nr:hypothetical protein [bacterium]
MSGKTKTILIILSVLGILIISGSKQMETNINYSEIGSTIYVIGQLGKPLGEIAEIQGEVIDSSETGYKNDMGKILFKVQMINGQKLTKDITITLRFFSWSGIEEPKPGDKKVYIGYESGEFTGIPPKAFDYIPAVTTTMYHFETHFQVCK